MHVSGYIDFKIIDNHSGPWVPLRKYRTEVLLIIVSRLPVHMLVKGAHSRRELKSLSLFYFSPSLSLIASDIPLSLVYF